MPMFRIGSPGRITVVLCLVFLVASNALAGQLVVAPTAQGAPPRDRVPPPRTGTGVVRGRVVDGVTGASVARARVTFQGGKRSSMITDGSGVFSFTELPTGPVMISVDKATYLSTRFPAPGRTFRSNTRPVILADGQVMENVTIPIFHGASISGRVLDANGDPLDYAQVNVLRIPTAGRLGHPSQRGSGSTDDRGEFRVGRLEAGTYIVQVTPRRQPSPGEMVMTPGANPAPPSAEPLPTYYPGSLAIEQAQPITLDKGQAAADIDVVLSEGIPGVVNGVVTVASGAPPGESNSYVNVRRIMSESMGYDSFSSGTGVRPDGTFRLVLAPGEYQLEARVAPRVMNGPTRPEDEQFGTAKITVASAAEDSVAITVGRGAIATGRVVFEGTTPPPPSPGMARVPLFSETGQCRSGQATIAPDWTFRIEGLSGTCSAPPMQMFGRWSIKAVVVNGENAAGAPITFQPGQQFRNVQVIVTDKRSDMLFQVSDENGQTTRDYVILVYPVDKARWVNGNGARVFVGPSEQMIAAVSMLRPPQAANAPGSSPAMQVRREAMSGLSLGEYYVVAVDDMEPDDSRDPVVLERLRSSALRVTLSEAGDSQVALRRINFADVMSKR
jgi:Carboxypeptidase regulatory-like domain